MGSSDDVTGPVFRVVLAPGEDGYIVAECVDLAGCMSQGKTETEALENIEDAIKACLSVILEDALTRVGGSAGGATLPGSRAFRPRIELVGLTA